MSWQRRQARLDSWRALPGQRRSWRAYVRWWAVLTHWWFGLVGAALGCMAWTRAASTLNTLAYWQFYVWLHTWRRWRVGSLVAWAARQWLRDAMERCEARSDRQWGRFNTFRRGHAMLLDSYLQWREAA